MCCCTEVHPRVCVYARVPEDENGCETRALVQPASIVLSFSAFPSTLRGKQLREGRKLAKSWLKYLIISICRLL